MRKQKVSRQVNFPMAFQSAESFRRLALPYIQKLDSDPRGPLHAAADGTGDLVACATNITLSLELFLKSMLAGMNVPIPDTHDLWRLFRKMSPSNQAYLEHHYRNVVSALPEKQRLPLKLAIEASDTGPTPGNQVEFPEKPIDPMDLKTLLKRTGNSFTSWRYIYESVKQGERFYFIEFEYNLLATLSKLLRDTIIEHDTTNKKTQKEIE